jgi:deazaflavin-dependent oxidoreductase (nitroreductase family)
MPISMRVARFNRHVSNRVTRPFADRLPGFGILTHVGRVSGRVYTIPINIFPDGDDYVIALTYGPHTDWAKNVLAAGGCEVLTRGKRVMLANPRIEDDPQRRWAPKFASPFIRLLFGAVNITQLMRLTVVK